MIDSNITEKPEAKATTHSDDETLTQIYSAHIQTGDPPLEMVLQYSNGSKKSFRKIMELLIDFSRNQEEENAQVKPAPKDYQMRELQAQALLRLRLWDDYGNVFAKQYKKKFGKKAKRKKLTENELILRDISHLFSLAAFQLSPQEPFDEYLRHALDEISGDSVHKQQIFDAFEVSPLREKGEDEHLEPALPALGENPAKNDSQKPKAKRKKSEVSAQSDRHVRCPDSSQIANSKEPNSTKRLPVSKRLEITAPIRRNSLTQKSRFVGSHFNSGNVDALFRHVKSSIPASRTVKIPQDKRATVTIPKRNLDAPGGQVLSDAPLQKTSEEEAKGIFQTNDKPARRRSSLVADALRALKRRDNK